MQAVLAWTARWSGCSQDDRDLVAGMAFKPARKVEFDQDKLYLGRFQPGMAYDLVHMDGAGAQSLDDAAPVVVAGMRSSCSSRLA